VNEIRFNNTGVLMMNNNLIVANPSIGVYRGLAPYESQVKNVASDVTENRAPSFRMGQNADIRQ
jgi:hypothetical protein